MTDSEKEQYAGKAPICFSGSMKRSGREDIFKGAELTLAENTVSTACRGLAREKEIPL